jgi:uncharacterized membrane protein
MGAKTRWIVTAALASLTGCAMLRGNTPGPDASNPRGRCFGVAGPGQGDCAGKDERTGDSWGCSGSNTTADNGWKRMTRDQCERTEKHPAATKKSFLPFS